MNSVGNNPLYWRTLPARERAGSERVARVKRFCQRAGALALAGLLLGALAALAQYALAHR